MPITCLSLILFDTLQCVNFFPLFTSKSSEREQKREAEREFAIERIKIQRIERDKKRHKHSSSLISVYQMGLLTEGTPLTWEEIIAVREVFQYYALSQLVRIFEKSKDRQGDSFMWGDEVV